MFFAHNGLGIVISSEAKIGDNCKIYQNVTIGAGNGGYPTIGNNVIIFPNSVIAGKIKIGDNAIIGACSFVNKDVEDNINSEFYVTDFYNIHPFLHSIFLITLAGFPATIVLHGLPLSP